MLVDQDHSAPSDSTRIREERSADETETEEMNEVKWPKERERKEQKIKIGGVGEERRKIKKKNK